MTLTLDSTLQFLAFDELQDTLEKTHARDGAVLIMDPINGDIMAMVQSPLFDPNNRTAVDLEITKNKMVTEAYELGSVMKTFLALAALEEGVVAPEEIIDCENRKYAYINGMRIGTLHEHGKISFSEVIELSNNIGTSKVALRLGEKFYDHLTRCGFGQKTGLDFPGEQRGFVNPPSNWSKRSIFSLSFGYEMRLSLLQLARAFSLLANNGILVTPRLIKSVEIKPVSTEKLYRQKTIEQLREMLKKAVTQGTARRAKIDGYETLGKTGTACILVDGKYSMDRNIFTFAGLVERGNYKRVIVTFVREVPKKDATASTVTVPLFERIAKKMLIHDKII
jgi:cell division protein FtsI (penicillin-binding protein 3)